MSELDMSRFGVVDMANQKIIQVADAVHGSIQISMLEKEIISTQVFNRLHNVMQNSTAYLTYPSNETKRFEHSLGCLYLAGKMFYHSIVNADAACRQEFMNQLAREIETITHSSEFSQRLPSPPDATFLLQSEPLYMANIPGVIERGEKANFILIWQAIRCAALLHDVGHPPFSHVSESALNELMGEIEAIPESRRSERQRRFVEILSPYFYGDGQLHEAMGLRLANHLMESVESLSDADSSDQTRYFILLVHELTKRILEEASDFFQDVHYLISGALDCDRLDYVVRDLKNSGFGYSQIEYDRLLHSMRLVAERQRFRWCPDVRALSTVEDFFHKRWSLYKYMIYHHRVIKTDSLLKQAILSLARTYLTQEEAEEKTAKYVLPLNISGLWRALPKPGSDEDYYDALIQWDDAWLLSVLRKEFFEHYRDEAENPVKYQLEELLSNRKYFSSLIKRADDFTIIDSQIAQNLTFDWDRLRQVTSILDASIQTLQKDLENYCALDDQDLVPKAGFFVNRFRRAFDLVCGKGIFEEVVGSAVAHVASTHHVPHHFVTFKNLKTGLQTSPDLCRLNTIIRLDAISRVKEELTANQMVFPPFFIYWRKESRVDEVKFKQEIGSRIGQQLSQSVTSALSTESW